MKYVTIAESQNFASVVIHVCVPLLVGSAEKQLSGISIRLSKQKSPRKALHLNEN